MPPDIKVAKLAGADLHFRFIYVCPYCEQKNAFIIDAQSSNPDDALAEIDKKLERRFAGTGGVDSIKCWYCNKISFLDEQHKDSRNEDEPVPVQGAPVS